MYLKILSLGFIIYYVNKPIVKYRIHSNNHSSQNTLVISEHLKILNDYRSSEGFKLNYYIFCKNVILNLIQANKFSLIPIKILLNKNIILTFILIDITFWYKFAKILVKKLLNKKK